MTILLYFEFNLKKIFAIYFDNI